MKSIGLDMDSCLNDLETQWLLTDYNKEYNDTLELSDMTCWDVETYIKPQCGKKIYDILLRPNYFFNLKPKEHSIQIVDALSKRYELFVVTAYNPKTVMDKCAWIEKYHPCIDPRKIIFCNNKGMIDTDYLIDDGGHNIISYGEKPHRTPIIFDRPWNHYLGNKYTRALDWIDVGSKLL